MHLAKTSQTQEIKDLYTACRKQMEAQQIFQWYKGYPNISNVQEDIQQQCLFVANAQGLGLDPDNEKCLAVICLNEEQDAVYSKVNWKYTEGQILVVHRLAIHPKFQNKGIGHLVMDFAEAFAQQEAYTAIRLDVYTGNPQAVQFYKKRGYQICGEVNFSLRELPFYCMEKLIV